MARVKRQGDIERAFAHRRTEPDCMGAPPDAVPLEIGAVLVMTAVVDAPLGSSSGAAGALPAGQAGSAASPRDRGDVENNARNRPKRKQHKGFGTDSAIPMMQFRQMITEKSHGRSG